MKYGVDWEQEGQLVVVGHAQESTCCFEGYLKTEVTGGTETATKT